MNTREVRDLVQLCAAGRDSEVWREFLDLYDSRLRTRVRRVLARYDARLSGDEREDLLQEVYCRLLEKRGRRLKRCRGECEGAVSSYLGLVAESVVVDYLRTISAAKRGRGLVLDIEREAGFELADVAPDPSLSPEEQLLLRERKAAFFRSCREIIGRQRPDRNLGVLYLALIEGWTSREICDRVGRGLTPSTVDSLVYRLKKKLSEQGVAIPRRCPGVASRTPRG